MFRQKANLRLFQTPITPPEDQQASKEPQLQEQPRQLPQQGLSLLQRRQLRQQQLGLEVPLQTMSADGKVPSLAGPSSLPTPPKTQELPKPVATPVDLGNIYNVDKSKTLGEESQFKVAYKATRDNRNYVLFVFKKLTGSEGEMQPENKEIKIFEKLIKENRCENYAICPVQVGVFEGSIAIVTEFIEGVTLAKLIEILKDRSSDDLQKNSLTIPLVGDFKLGYLYGLQLFEKIIRSLQFIHNTWKFVHLDIKPDNIMMSNDGSSIHIIDLGSGCFSPEIVNENCENRFAAEAFIAPESVFPDEEYWDFNKNSSPEQKIAQFENWKKADIYSVGKVFEYFLTMDIVSFGCDDQKAQLNSLIKRMTDNKYTQRPDSSQVLLELANLRMIQCAGGISQLARCFF